MKLFAISDLHLSSHTPKPMNIFGMQWDDHWAKIQAAWRAEVSAQDAVLLPGDLSWAMTLQQASPDLAEISELPGEKILLRGNHDYWWSSIGSVRAKLLPGMHAVQNDALRVGPVIVCGTRGWTCPGSSAWGGETDRKIYEREILRLKLSLDAAQRIRAPGQKLIAMLHFPPFDDRAQQSGFTELMEAYEVNTVV